MKFAKTPEAALSLAYAEVLRCLAVARRRGRRRCARHGCAPVQGDDIPRRCARGRGHGEANFLSRGEWAHASLLRGTHRAGAQVQGESGVRGCDFPPRTAGRSIRPRSSPTTRSNTACGPTPFDHNIPTDGPYVDYTPHPTGVPDKKRPDYQQPRLVSMEGFNHKSSGVADPWLAPDKTVSSGNNVHAYSDRDDQTQERRCRQRHRRRVDSADFEALPRPQDFRSHLNTV